MTAQVSNFVAFGLGALLMFIISSLTFHGHTATPKESLSHFKTSSGAFEDLTQHNFEHLKGVRESTFHHRMKDTWSEQSYSRPYLDQEREVPCSNKEATEKNFYGVSIVRAALENAGDHYPLRLDHAMKAFLDAINLDHTCVTPRLNYLILMAGIAAGEEDSAEGEPSHSIGMTEREKAILDASWKHFDMIERSKWTAKMFLWRAIYEEFMTGHGGNEYFEMAFSLDSKLRAEYIHPTFHSVSILQDARQRPAAPVIRRGLVQLLFHYEFAPATGGYGKFKIEDAMRFKRDWRGKVDNFLPPFCYLVIARTYGAIKDKIERKDINIQWIAGYKGSASYESNADALNQWYNIKIKEFVDRFTGVEVVPTYGYAAGYIPGDVLKPHTDRAACEFTLTVLVSAHPHPSFCPLYAQKTPWKIDHNWIGRYEEETIKKDNVMNLQPQLNQLLILRGRAVPHFRPALPKSIYCQTFLAHFTPIDKSE